MRINLDNSLSPTEIKSNDYIKFLSGLSKTTGTVRTTIYEGKVYHKNYLEYLQTAWSNHRGIRLDPDIFWYTILCEFASYISENSELFRDLFTTSPGETEITVPTSDPIVLPLD